MFPDFFCLVKTKKSAGKELGLMKRVRYQHIDIAINFTPEHFQRNIYLRFTFVLLYMLQK